MKDIRIEEKGLILEGKYKDWYIYVEDLDKGEGAYLILYKSPDGSKGYDDWVENYQDLEGYFVELGSEIEWIT